MGNPPVNGLTLWIRGWLCCFFLGQIMINQEILGCPCSFPEKSPWVQHQEEPQHSSSPGLASASHSQKAQGTLQHCAIGFFFHLRSHKEKSIKTIKGHAKGCTLVTTPIWKWYMSPFVDDMPRFRAFSLRFPSFLFLFQVNGNPFTEAGNTMARVRILVLFCLMRNQAVLGVHAQYLGKV